MRNRIRKELGEVQDPNHRRLQLSPFVELSLADERCRRAAEEEHAALCGCDRPAREPDPVGSPLGSPGPNPVESEFSLLEGDPSDGVVLGDVDLLDAEPDPFDLL